MYNIETISCADLLNEKAVKATLSNGFTVYVYPMPLKQSVYALLSADIGSTTREFSLGGRQVNVPSGVAHFLEHKMFESEKGDAFELFAKTGASANAYTSFERTCFLFSSSINVPQSLEILLSFVAEPYFTDETVKKEQGIIAQEIKMYDDSPDWQLALTLLKNLYVSHPVREDIAGTVDSIAEITPQVLYDCYNAFYRPEKMTLCVAGNIEPEVVFEIAERAYGSKKNVGGDVVCKKTVEPQDVTRAFSLLEMNISMPQFALGFKHTPTPQSEKAMMSVASRMLASLLVGDTTEFYRDMYDGGLLNETFDASTMDGQDFCCSAFSGESAQPEKAAELIKNQIKKIQREGFDQKRFEELRRALIGSEICVFDSAEAIATRMMEAHYRGYSIFDMLSCVKSVTADDVSRLLDRFSDVYSSLVIMRPKA